MYLAQAQAEMKAKWAAREEREASRMSDEELRSALRKVRTEAVRKASKRKVLLTPHAVKKFWSQVTKSKACWLWIGPKAAHGYGHFTYNYMQIMAHRYAWILTNGAMPSKQEAGLLHVHHRCKTKACVRPDHLQLVDPKQHRWLHKKVQFSLDTIT